MGASWGVIAIVLLLLVAIALIVVGVRGRCVHDRPVCARCGFDVTGLVARELGDRTTFACPECGAKLDRPGSIQQGLRKRRRVVLTMGILLLLLGVSVGVLGVTKGITHRSVATRLPTPVLVGLLRVDPDDEYLLELAARIGNGQTGTEENSALAMRLRARQVDTAATWSPGWNVVLMSLYVVRAITDDDLDAALRASMSGTIDTRDRVRSSALMAIRTSVTVPKWDVPTVATVGIGTLHAEFRDAKGIVVGTIEQRGFSLQSWRKLSACVMGSSIHVPQLAPGVYDLDLTVTVVAGVGPRGNSFTLPVEIPTRLIKRIEVVAADTPVVDLVESPEHAEQIRAAIWSMTAGVSHGITPAQLQLSVNLKGLPVGIGYRVWAKPAGVPDTERFELGTLAVGADVNPNLIRGYSVTGELPSGFDAKAIDVIFEPDPLDADANVDLREIASVPLRFENVKVDWGAPNAR